MICFESVNKLRKLPCCSQRFCEECLIRYVTELKLKPKEEEIPVQCPVCRQINSGPRTDQDTSDWVQKLVEETNSFEKIQGKMEEAENDFCAGCKESNKDLIAARFCFECREYFCQTCCDFIHKIKAFKDHSLLTLDTETDHTNREINRMMMKYVTCERHPDKSVAFLCRDDDKLCCITCAIDQNRKGKYVLELTDFTTEENNNTKADELISKFEKLTTLSESIIAKKNEMEPIEKEETNTVVNEIRNMRQHVNGLFDSLEANVLQQCRAATKEHRIVAMEDVEMIRETIKNIKFSQVLLSKSKQIGSVKVSCAVNYNLEKTLKDIETMVMEMKSGCKQYGFDLQVEEVLEQLLAIEVNHTQESLACVKEKESPQLLPDFLEKQLVQVVNRPICTMKKHNVILTGGGKEVVYTGVVYLPDLRIAVVDNGTNSDCSLISANCEVLASCKIEGNADNDETVVKAVMKDGTSYDEFCEYNPIGVAYLHNGFIAVSVGMKKIYFLTTQESLRVMFEFHTQFIPYSLFGLKNGDFAVAWKDPWSFGIMSVSRYGIYEEKVHIEREKNGRTFKTFRYLAVDESRLHIVQPCIVDRAVYCFDYQGNSVFTYTDDRLVFPQGVAVDIHGNIYVCDSRTSCVHVISHTGTGMGVIFEGGEIYWPIALALNPDNSECIVTHGGKSNHMISIYKLKYERE